MAKSPFYLDDDEFYYEIVLSKGKGFLTKKAEGMLIKIANNFNRFVFPPGIYGLPPGIPVFY